MLKINEEFLSFQGEGPSTGRLAYFVRLQGCNLHCTWCDTKYTWRQDSAQESISIDDIVDRIAKSKANICVVTGGEPLYQDHETLARFVKNIHIKVGIPVEFETNGVYNINEDSVNLSRYVTQWNVSPKLSNSGNYPLSEENKVALFRWKDNHKAIFKFVVGNLEDLQEVVDLVEEIDIYKSRIWIMPKGTTHDEQLNTVNGLLEEIKKLGFNLSLRMHTIIWNDKRGV